MFLEQVVDEGKGCQVQKAGRRAVFHGSERYRHLAVKVRIAARLSSRYLDTTTVLRDRDVHGPRAGLDEGVRVLANDQSAYVAPSATEASDNGSSA